MNVIFLSGMAHAGQEVGNGGDVVVCQKSIASEFDGYYSLDYLLTYPAPKAAAVKTWQDSLQRIGDLIKSKVPELYLSFKSFQDDVLNESYSNPHVWEQAPFGLTPIDDEDIAVRLPENCLENGKIKLIQAVIRLNPDYSGAETQVFKYMPSVLDILNKDRQIQTSFLLVHEWLWEVSKNVDRNRRINRYLHSQLFATHSAADAINQLKGVGLSLTGDAYAFDSIQSAVDNALPNATVWIFDRTYREKVTIAKPITLRPINGANPLIVTGGIHIQSDNTVLQDLNFSLIESGSVSVAGKNIKLKGNRFGTADGSGTAILLSESASALIADNTFNSLPSAIMMFKSSEAEISHNEFIGGIALDITRAQAKLTSNHFLSTWVDVTGNWDEFHSEVTKVEFEKNVFEKCVPHCLRLREDVQFTVEDNEFSESNSGITIFDRALGSIHQNQFVQNDTALSLFDKASKVEVSANLFKRNKTAIDNVAKLPIGPNKFIENIRDVE